MYFDSLDELMNEQKFPHIFNIATRVFQDFVGEEAISTTVMIGLNSGPNHRMVCALCDF